ncbi:hypothetical protein HU200_012201 [Digitaria exilis]|uniref:Uncharacterized protein n=1 Tax=Digitaria exilis TaxID=1010633 RepID=A0A835FFW9_9POAL|nr:hypothetical protein HU200_012201 [Digitaria exilis]
MDAASLLSVALALAALIPILLFLLNRLLYGKLPPGPRPRPVVGNLFDVQPVRCRCYQEWARKYGPIMTVWLGSEPTVVVSTAELAKEVLKTHDQSLADRQRDRSSERFSRGGMDLIWADYGAHYIKVRKLCNLELFTPRRLEALRPIREDEVTAMVESIYTTVTTPGKYENGNLSVGLLLIGTRGFQIAQGLCLYHVSQKNCAYFPTYSPRRQRREALGGKEPPLDGGLQQHHASGVREAVRERRRRAGRAGSRVQVDRDQRNQDRGVALHRAVHPVAQVAGPRRRADLQGARRPARRLTVKIMDEHAKALKERGAQQHFVDALFTLRDKYDLSDDTVIGLLWDMITAGTDTTVISVEWAMAELVKNPRVQEKVQEELDRVVGRDRVLLETDFPNLPYLQALVKESLRLHPPTPLMLPHKASSSVKIAGYDIPKGANVIVNVWAVARDPNVWDNPLEFRPERFLQENIDIKGADFRVLPFGAGRRVCPGAQLGINLVASMIGHLLHNFSWRLPEGTRPEDVEMMETPGLVTFMATPLKAVATPRLDKEELYRRVPYEM